MAEISGGNISFGVTFDVDKAKADLDNIRAKISKLGESMEEQDAEISKLEKKFTELGKKAADAFMSGDDSLSISLRNQQAEIKKSITDIKEEQAAVAALSDKYEEQAAAIEKQIQENDKLEKKHVSLRSQMKDVREQMAALEIAGEKGGAAYMELATKAGELQDAFNDTSKAMRNMASDTRALDSIIGGVSFGTDVVEVATGAMGLFGASAEEAAEMQTKLQAAMALANGVKSIQNALQKESNLMLGIATLQQKAHNKAVALGNVGTKAATIAQKAFNRVAKANPYVLIATGIAAVAAAMLSFGKKTKEATEAQVEANDAMSNSLGSAKAEMASMNAYVKIAGDVNKSLDQRKKAIAELNSKYPALKASLDTESNQLMINTQAYEDYKTAIINAAKAKAYEENVSEWTGKEMQFEAEATQRKKDLDAARNEYGRVLELYNGGAKSLAELKNAYNDLNDAENAYNLAVRNRDTSRYNAQVWADRAANVSTNNGGGNQPQQPGKKVEFFSPEWLDKASEKDAGRYWKHFFLSMEHEAKNNKVVVPIEIPEELAEEEIVPDIISAAQLRVEKLAEGTTERLQAELALQEQILALMVRNEGESEEAFQVRVQRQRNAIKEAKNAIDENNTNKEVKKYSTIAGYVNNIADAMGEVSKGMDNGALKSFISAFRQVASLSDTIAENIKSTTGEDGSKSLSVDWAAAGPSLIASAFNMVLSTIVNSVKEMQELNAKSKEWVNTLELAKYQLEDIYSSAFGEDVYTKSGDAAKKAKEAQKAYENALAEANKTGTWWSTSRWNAGWYKGTKLGTRKLSSGNTLAQTMPELFNEDGSVNVDNIQYALDVYGDMMDSTTKEMLQNILNLKNAAEENTDYVTSYIADSFGDLSNSLMDGIINAVETGADSWGDFEDAGKNAIEGLIKQMAYSTFLKPIFDAYEQELKGIEEKKGKGELTNDEFLDEQMRLLNTYYDKLVAGARNATEWIRGIANNGTIKGLFTGEGTETMAGSIQNVTEQTASIIAGQMNAIRMQQVDSNSILRSQLQILSGIKSDTVFLRSIDAKLEGLQYNIRTINA